MAERAQPVPILYLRTLLIPCVLNLGEQRYSFFTTMTSFGTPRDITLAELNIELFIRQTRQPIHYCMVTLTLRRYTKFIAATWNNTSAKT